MQYNSHLFPPRCKLMEYYTPSVVNKNNFKFCTASLACNLSCTWRVQQHGDLTCVPPVICYITSYLRHRFKRWISLMNWFNSLIKPRCLPSLHRPLGQLGSHTARQLLTFWLILLQRISWSWNIFFSFQIALGISGKHFRHRTCISTIACNLHFKRECCSCRQLASTFPVQWNSVNEENLIS